MNSKQKSRSNEQPSNVRNSVLAWSTRNRGRLVVSCLLALAGLVMISWAVIAQEPRFRLRNVPQRLLNRLQPKEEALPNPASAAALDQVQKNLDLRQSDSPMSKSESSEAAGPSVDTQSGQDLAVVSLPSSSGLTAAPSEDPQRPLVLATEAEKNQEIAKNWPEPWACFFITGRQHGYVEPCGCTGLENQKGGLLRRDFLLSQMRERGWPMLPIDAGDQVRRKGKQAELKFAHTSNALKQMEYAAVGFGTEELKLTSTELYLQMTNLQGKQQSQFVSANVSVLSPNAPERWKVISLPSGRKIGFTSVLGDDYREEVPAGDIKTNPAVESLKPVAQQLASQKCDYLVLLVNASLNETRRIAQEVPGFDLVVTAGGHGEPLYKPEPITGTDAIMIQVGVKGMYVGLLALYDDEKEPFRYQRVALSSQFDDSERMTELFRKYQDELKKLGFAKLGLKALSHPSNREYVGTSKCAECHTTAYNIWKDTPHAHATESIVHPPERGDIARHFDPECISCHVTGWNPQEYRPYRSGYVSLESTEHLTANGCENCHGPGSEHVAFEQGNIEGGDDLRQKLIEEMRLPLDRARDKCLECHDLDNSPAFHEDGAFEQYWQEVAHYGKD